MYFLLDKTIYKRKIHYFFNNLKKNKKFLLNNSLSFNLINN